MGVSEDDGASDGSQNRGYYQASEEELAQIQEAYLEAERKTIMELQNIGKPFVVLVNSKKPYAKEAQETAGWLEETYGVRALAVNCEKLKPEDITKIMETVLYEFPVSEIEFFVPKWVEMLPDGS